MWLLVRRDIGKLWLWSRSELTTIIHENERSEECCRKRAEIRALSRALDVQHRHRWGETYEAEELLVSLLTVEARDRYSVGQVVGEGVNRIIDNDCLAQIAAKPVQVLDEHVEVRDGQAVLSVQPVAEELVVRVEQLEASVCVVFLNSKGGACEWPAAYRTYQMQDASKTIYVVRSSREAFLCPLKFY